MFFRFPHLPRLALLLSASSMLLFGTACYGPHSSRTIALSNPSAPGSGWQEISPQGTGYRVSMPGQPNIETESTHDFDGTEMVMVAGKYEVPNNAIFGFLVMYSENGHAPDPHAQAHSARRGSADEGNEFVRERNDYMHQGFPTQDRVTEIRDDGIVIFSRVSVGRSRIFYTYAMVRVDGEAKFNETIDYYLGSIRLHPSEAVSPAGDGALSVGSWQYVYPPEADFAISMPGSAARVEMELQVPDEEDPLEVFGYGVQSADRAHRFEVRVVRYGERPGSEQMDYVRGLVVEEGFRLVAERQIEVQGYAGREYVFESDESVIHMRLYSTAVRMYDLRVRVPSAFADRAAASRQSFFDSFRIL